jgi:hypothetical protein
MLIVMLKAFRSNAESRTIVNVDFLTDGTLPMRTSFWWMLVTLCAFTTTASWSQGMLSGFMQGSGNTGTSVSYSTEQYSKYYIGDSITDNPALGTISTRSASLYVVGGLTSFLDLVVGLPYISASSSAGYWETINGMQDISIYLRGRVVQFKTEDGSTLDVMLGGGISTPLTNYPNNAPVTIGHGSTNLDGRLIVQARDASTGLFVAAQGGYIHRSNVTIDRGFDVAVPDNIDVSARIGWTGPVYLDAWIYNTVGQSGTNIGPGVPFPTNRQSYLQVGGTAAWQLPFLPELSINAGMAHILTAQNVGKSTRFSFGINYNLPTWGGMQL